MKTKFYLAIVITAFFTFYLANNLFAQGATAGGSDPGMTGHAGGTAPQNARAPANSKYGENGTEIAHEISMQEAMQKYPPRGGKYPTAEITKGTNTGFSTTIIESPYPPHHKFDTSNIKRGALILDPYTKHVFIKP